MRNEEGEMRNGEMKDSPAYNLSGQRVGAGYKGIIIQNGRKVMKR